MENVKNRIFFKLLAVFLIVIAASAAILDVMLGSAWEASLRTEIERNLQQKTLLFAHRVETDKTHTLTDIAAQESRAAGARATIIDASGKVLADSESNPVTMENHATRTEFVAALAGNTGESERRSASCRYASARSPLFKAMRQQSREPESRRPRTMRRFIRTSPTTDMPGGWRSTSTPALAAVSARSPARRRTTFQSSGKRRCAPDAKRAVRTRMSRRRDSA